MGYGIVVALLNQMLYVLVAFTHPFLRHRNVTNDGKSAMLILFIAQFINTCFPLILVNLDLTQYEWVQKMGTYKMTFMGIDFGSNLLFSGSYTDTSRGWVTQIDMPIIATLVVFWFFSILFALFKVPAYQMVRSWKRRGMVLQLEYN